MKYCKLYISLNKYIVVVVVVVEDLKQTRRDRPVCKKKLGNYNNCEFSNFFLFQWPKMIISVLVTWIIVDCKLTFRVVLSF